MENNYQLNEISPNRWNEDELSCFEVYTNKGDDEDLLGTVSCHTDSSLKEPIIFWMAIDSNNEIQGSADNYEEAVQFLL